MLSASGLHKSALEMSNRIEWPEYADVVKELKLHLVEWMRETRDHLYTEYMVYYLTKNEDLALQAPGRGRVKWWDSKEGNKRRASK